MPTDDELREDMYFHPSPLSEIKSLEHEWLLGTWTLSKSHRTWRVGYGHSLVEGARIEALAFSYNDRPMIGLVFESHVDPPWYLIGWVPASRAQEAENWASFLNSEIANRLASLPAGENWTHDPRDGKTALDYEDKLEEEKFKRELGIKPFRPGVKRSTTR